MLLINKKSLDLKFLGQIRGKDNFKGGGGSPGRESPTCQENSSRSLQITMLSFESKFEMIRL